MRTKVFLGAASAVTVSLFWSGAAYAYSVPTHAYLTQEIADFYNRSFPERPLSAEVKSSLVQGSREEDATPRYLNHFYDPVHERGLSSDSGFAFAIPGTWNSAKHWAQSDAEQQGGLYQTLHAIASPAEAAGPDSTDFTWQSGIQAYASGDYERAGLVLGHIIHLIEDMGVPEHTRNDPHAWGCPYEDWTRQFTLEHGDPKLTERLQSAAPVLLGDLNSYFEQAARYTNAHFYSFHTIGISSGYSSPTPASIQPDRDGSYGLSEDGHKLFFNKGIAQSILVQGNATLDNEAVMHDYWDQLSVSVVRHGAGVIHLFIEEGEKAKSQKQTSTAAAESEKSSLLANMFQLAQRALTSSAAAPAPKQDIAFFASSAPAAAAVPEKVISSAKERKETPLPKPLALAPQVKQTVQPVLAEEAAPQVMFPSSTLPEAPKTEVAIRPLPAQYFSQTIVPAAISPAPQAAPVPVSLQSDPPEAPASSVPTPTSTTDNIPQNPDTATTTASSTPNPNPTSTPLQPGVVNLTWTTDIPTHGVIFTANIAGPILSQKAQMELMLLPANIAFDGTRETLTDPVPAGGVATKRYSAFIDGAYHWRARALDEDRNASDWSPEYSASIHVPTSTPLIAGAWSEGGFPNGYCGFGKRPVTPAEDMTLSSAEFYAACTGGSAGDCRPPNYFEVYDASNTLIARSDGEGVEFGHPDVTWNWQMFTGDNRVTLRKGVQYFVTPASSHGQCIVNPYRPQYDAFSLR